jgi:predicted dehydrogenase
VLALCDIDDKGLAAVGDEFSIPRRTKAIDDVLRMEDVEIVDICTPPALHVAQTLAALAAGKELVCEKPLAGSLSEVDRVIAAEARAAGRVMPVFQYRYGDGLQKAKRIIELGIAGNLISRLSRQPGDALLRITKRRGEDGGKPSSAACC